MEGYFRYLTAYDHASVLSAYYDFVKETYPVLQLFGDVPSLAMFKSEFSGLIKDLLTDGIAIGYVAGTGKLVGVLFALDYNYWFTMPVYRINQKLSPLQGISPYCSTAARNSAGIQQQETLYLYNVAVNEDFRRNGIATALLRKLSEDYVKTCVIVAKVQANPHRKLLQKAGYEEFVVANATLMSKPGLGGLSIESEE